MTLAVLERQRPTGATSPRRKALFFFYGCFLRQTDGCHIRAMQTLDLMVASGLDVTVYSYRQHPAWPWTDADVAHLARRYPTVKLVLDEGGRHLVWLGRTKRRLCLLGARVRDWVLRQRVPTWTPALDALLEQETFDTLMISYAEGLTQINGLPEGSIVIDAHDVTSLEKVRLQASGDLGLRTLRALKSEIGLLGAAAVVWSISYAEFWFLQEMLEQVRVRFVPPVFEMTPPSPGAMPDFDLLFVASDNRWNRAALPEFLESFASWRGGLRLAVAGKICNDQHVRELAAIIPGVELLGYQPSLPALYARARATICPVEGTGTKIKLIESLAFALPVFAAPGAFRGLAPGYEGCVLPLEETAVAAILGNPAALDDARTACRAYARNYAFDTVLKAVETDFQPRTARAIAA
jgi:glycosyltransferase involved in cell wall biosynthesis